MAKVVEEKLAKSKFDCSKCDVEMENKGIVRVSRDYAWELYQCPNCKNVEVI